jgi:hypothetical protein
MKRRRLLMYGGSAFAIACISIGICLLTEGPSGQKEWGQVRVGMSYKELRATLGPRDWPDNVRPVSEPNFKLPDGISRDKIRIRL